MPASNYSYCPADLGNHISSDCAPRLKSGISAIAVILAAANIVDYSDANEVQDAIDDGLFKVIGGCARGTKFEYPAASKVEGDVESACQVASVDGGDHVINGEDFNVSAENDEFYGQLQNVKGAFLGLYYCADDKFRLIQPDGGVIFWVTNPVSDFDFRIKQRYIFEATWFQPVGNIGSQLFDAPPGIFC